MERWQGKTAVVTGASAGIGAAVAVDLAKNRFNVVALARRIERLCENQQALAADLKSRYHVKKCDVTNEKEVKDTFEWIEKKFGGTDVLVNNAGISRLNVQLSDLENTKEISEVINTNVIATVFCVREAFNSMKKRNFDGHIVIVNSVVGHLVPQNVNFPGFHFNIYPASKFAITAMVETYRQEFANAGTKVKVTSISPGGVETEFAPNMEKLRDVGYSLLYAADVSNAILYAIGTPPHVQIHELIIKPLGEKV